MRNKINFFIYKNTHLGLERLSAYCMVRASCKLFMPLSEALHK